MANQTNGQKGVSPEFTTALRSIIERLFKKKGVNNVAPQGQPTNYSEMVGNKQPLPQGQPQAQPQQGATYGAMLGTQPTPQPSPQAALNDVTYGEMLKKKGGINNG